MVFQTTWNERVKRKMVGDRSAWGGVGRKHRKGMVKGEVTLKRLEKPTRRLAVL